MKKNKISKKYSPTEKEKFMNNKMKEYFRKKLLKWKPTITVEKGLKLTYEWAKNNKVIFDAPFTRFYYKKNLK